MFIGPVGGMAQGMSDLRDSVLSGGVTFTEEAANALKSAMKDIISDMESINRHVSRVSQEPSIGETPAAKVFKPFLASVATDTVQGFVPAHDKMLQDAQDILAALDKQAESVKATDDAVAGGVGGAAG